MRHLLIGDGHYRGQDEERIRWSKLVSRISCDGIEQLSILGDFFELWIGLEGTMASWQTDMLAELRTLAEAGTQLRYIVGNKDYFVADWNKKHRLFDQVIETSCYCESPQGGLHLAHGDLVNRADTQYRAWRYLSRSLPMRIVTRSLPRAVLAKIGDRIARALEKTNQSHKVYFPESELESRALELPPGPATQIYGHFHVHRDLRFGDKRVITLPFLATENAGILVDASGFHRYPV